MLRSRRGSATMLGLALAGVLVFAGQGRAQHAEEYPWFGYTWSGYPAWQAGQYQHWGSSGGFSSSSYSPLGYSYAAPYTASYTPTLNTNNNVAVVEVLVPAGAKVWFDENLTSQTGMDRFFTTPALQPGTNYKYQVRATWIDSNGRAVTKTREVSVQAGKRSAVDFNQ